MSETVLDSLTVNGVTYVRADKIPVVQPIKGKRAVIIVDRGWIVAGDVTEENGRIKLTRAVHVLNWTGGQGFAGMIANPKKHVTINPLPTGWDMPADAEIMRTWVDDSWGL